MLALNLQDDFSTIFRDAFALRLINKAMLRHGDFWANAGEKKHRIGDHMTMLFRSFSI
jgi:hypothetical protein